MSLIGNVDVFSNSNIAGWATDPSDPEHKVSVDILINSAPVARVRADALREDLRQAGIGEGRVSFQFNPAPYLKPGRNDVEAQYSATGLRLPKGYARLFIRAPEKGMPYGPCAHFVAVLQAYHQANPGHHICEIGPGRLRSAITEGQLPCREYSTLDLAGGPAALARIEKADLVLGPGCEQASPELTAALKSLLEDHTNRPCYLALDFPETDDAAGQIRRMFLECGVRRVQFDSIPCTSGDGRRLFAFGEMGGGESAGTEPPPVLAHIHVPKCAGTSFRILIDNYFGPDHLRLYSDVHNFVHTEDALREYLLLAPETRAFSSHSVRTFPRWLAGREMFYVTFLRDPIQQFISYVTHIKKRYAGITSPVQLAAVPPDAPRLTSREFARWLLRQDRDIPFRENRTVNFFANHSAPGKADRLEAAQAALSGFFFVGITERMDESVSKLRALAQSAGLSFPQDPVPTENTSSECRDDLSWIHSADEVGSMLLRSVEKDRQLYDWAVARWEQDFQPSRRPDSELRRRSD